VAGSIAGVVSRTFIAPVERVKILFQISKASTSSRRGYLHYIPEIYQNEGILAFWRGNSAAVIRVVPYMSITFLSYEQYKVILHLAGFTSNPCNLLAGSFAGMTAVITTYPLDLVRARLAKQQTGLKSLKYKNMWDALINIPREEGRQTGDGRIRIHALYRGLLATMIGEAPYAGLKFCMYEAMKTGLSDLWGVREHELSPLTRVSCGALSGLMAVSI
jgi:solute carrier family 25 protein 42